MNKKRNVLLYGDVDLRYTDGSAVWLASMAHTLSLTQSNVMLLLKSSLGEGGLFSDLLAIDGLEIIDDFSSKRVRGPRYQPLMASRRIESLVADRDIDVVICRGFAACRQVASQPEAGKRLWAYMTDIPQTSKEMTGEVLEDLTFIANTAQRIFAQTNEARDFLEYHIPAARRKTLVLSPMLPDLLDNQDELVENKDEREASSAIRLVYAGKFARAWKTLEMCDLPRRAAELGLSVELTMIGDKFQNDPDDPEWSSRMREKIQSAPGVRWLGRMSREETMREVAQHDAGLAWRSPELDGSHEISTKLLEYLACGVPPILNRTAMHENLLGKIYPLFVEHGDVYSPMRFLASATPSVSDLRMSIRNHVDPFRISVRSDYLEAEITRAIRERSGSFGKISLNVVGGEPFRESIEAIFGDLIEKSLTPSGTQVTQELADEPSHMTLIDSMELTRDFAADHSVWVLWRGNPVSTPIAQGLDIAGVLVQDAKLRLQAARWANLPVGRVFVIPNAIDHTARRTKTNSAEHTVGIIVEEGDEIRAVREAHTLLTNLIAKDSRFTLRLFLPTGKRLAKDVWSQELLLDALSDLALDPVAAGSWSIASLSGAARWLREVGWIAGSKEDTVRSVLGHTAALAGTVELPPLVSTGHSMDESSIQSSAMMAVRIAEDVAEGRWRANAEQTSNDASAIQHGLGELSRVLAAASA